MGNDAVVKGNLDFFPPTTRRKEAYNKRANGLIKFELKAAEACSASLRCIIWCESSNDWELWQVNVVIIKEYWLLPGFYCGRHW